MKLSRRLVAALVLGLAASLVSDAAEKRTTPAEAAGFRSTPRYEETLEFVRGLAATTPEMRLQFFGTSAQGRKLPLIVVAKDGAFTPEAAAKSGRAIVLVQNGIHAGEIDGKDASLMILRDLAAGRHKQLLDSLILLIVPIYNVDGHERVSPFNRPNQNGPELGMGFRTTADGHDLNRDHLKLSTPEARAAIGLFNRWRPHLHVDNHVTDGSEHAWVLTYSWIETPQLAAPLDDWMDAHMPRVIAATKQAGHRIGPYAGMIDANDPAQGVTSYVGEPRFATGYYPLRHCPSILVENHSYKPYRERVLANRDFMLALFEEIAAKPSALIDAVRRAQRRTVELGRRGAPPSDTVLRYRTAAATDRLRFAVYDWSMEPSAVMGIPIITYGDELREIDVPWVHTPEPELAVRRPRGYLVLRGWPAIEQRLAGHGLAVRRLDAPAELEVETLRIAYPEPTADWAGSYQGLTRPAVRTERHAERRSFPAGTLWVAADQPDFEVAAQLLEPEAPDSMVSWGLLSLVLERKEYIEPRVLEGHALKLLENDELADEWAAALEDPGFAANPWARFIWWYRRTEFWDETIGLLPAMRLMHDADLATSPWDGPVAD